jgi:threonine/homoserine/homoserine lactone efflux protein
VEPYFFLKGLIVGFIICAPLGPIGMFCVRQTLVEGRLAGMFAVLGASVVDAIYCIIAGLGVTYISNLLTNEHVYLQMAGGIFLVLVGLHLFFSRLSEKTPEAKGHGLLPSFLSSFLVMLANPMPILVFTAILTGLGIRGWRGHSLATTVVVAGVFIGSAAWGPILAFTVNLIKTQISPRLLRLANRIAGAAIFVFGAVVCILAILKLWIEKT